MNYIIGDQNYDPEGMVAFQAGRRADLEQWHRGDRSVLGPATGSPYKRPSPAVPAPILRPMSEAPRDGSKIKLHRKPHPNLRYPVVTAYWKHFSAHHGFWFSSALGAIGDDDFVIGWEEI